MLQPWSLFRVAKPRLGNCEGQTDVKNSFQNTLLDAGKVVGEAASETAELMPVQKLSYLTFSSVSTNLKVYVHSCCAITKVLFMAM